MRAPPHLRQVPREYTTSPEPAKSGQIPPTRVEGHEYGMEGGTMQWPAKDRRLVSEMAAEVMNRCRNHEAAGSRQVRGY